MDANTIRKKISDKLDERELSYESIERKAGISRFALRNFLVGKVKQPRLDVIVAAAKFLEIAPSEIFGASAAIDNDFEKKKTDEFIIEYDNKLLITCLDYLTKCITLSGKKIDLDSTLDLLKRVYVYSAKYSNENADKAFIEWSVDNFN